MTPYSLPLRSYLELGALPGAVPCARLHARQLAWEWGLTGLAATAELLVSELVTNAVKTMAGQGNQAAVRLRLSSDNARFLIEVQDADPRPPVPKDLGADGLPDVQEEGGRGLFLVAALSVRWDWYPTQPPGFNSRPVISDFGCVQRPELPVYARGGGAGLHPLGAADSKCTG